MTDELRMTGLLAGLPPIPADTPWVKVLEKVYVQMQLKTLAYADKLRIYTHLDDVSEEVLDVLAVQFKVDWYDQSWPLETKRRVIKTALEVRRFYGTDWATETALSSIYPGSKIIEWYDYGGTPGHFIVECNVSDSRKQPSIAEIKRITNIYKRMTAHLERIYFTVAEENAAVAYTAGTVQLGYGLTMRQDGNIQEATNSLYVGGVIQMGYDLSIRQGGYEQMAAGNLYTAGAMQMGYAITIKQS